MNKTELSKLSIENKLCIIHSDDKPGFILIQPADKRELESLDKETAHIKSLTDSPFVLVAFEITDWNSELSPWTAPPVFGLEPFGNCAGETLNYLENALIPELTSRFGSDLPIILGGYSLAGLFSLWAAYTSERFNAVAAVSPSVWFPSWLDYIENRSPYAKSIYLSLGKKEEKTRNRTMAAVGENIRRQYEILNESGVNCVLEWNEGNHFAEPEIRTAKGFAWCINAV
jgi:predicted alpha/beta superfamily hydrolase